ncbi:hypothetical protein PAXRUDRAFT_490288 [Paxillus rubicundulus Ve08.2h10]|uniref:Uncharacterized protein n=1 Tax=Paxillus rubicundulus Ve08.2h10 TaxID=930991 RepID=A0A0D0CWI4_9AGAM|nr:hypothetical protein PAXRUDRAFT_490288 [Paxillus rubicundulus Ve08.2h10]
MVITSHPSFRKNSKNTPRDDSWWSAGPMEELQVQHDSNVTALALTLLGRFSDTLLHSTQPP